MESQAAFRYGVNVNRAIRTPRPAIEDAHEEWVGHRFALRLVELDTDGTAKFRPPQVEQAERDE